MNRKAPQLRLQTASGACPLATLFITTSLGEMESKTATALAAGIVTVITPLVFPTIPMALGIALYTFAGALFVYAGRDRITPHLPWSWQRKLTGGRGADAKKLSTAGSDLPDHTGTHQGPAELTQHLVAKLVRHPIHPKTLQVVRFIAAQEKPEFLLDDAIRAVSGAESYLDLRGAWAGLTRRTRKLLHDPEAQLIQWRETYDANGNPADWIGRVSVMTHASLRKHFRT